MLRTNRNRPACQMLLAVTGLIKDWWRADCIRVSPRDGQLLRIQAPCIIRVGDQIVEVVRRSVGQTTGGSYVVYGCERDGEACELWVRPDLSNRVRWIDGDGEHQLNETDVVVYG